MNDERRKEIQRARDLLAEVKAILEQVQSEEQDYYDNMPESFQNGDKGTKASEAADKLQEAVDAVDEVDNAIEEAVN